MTEQEAQKRVRELIASSGDTLKAAGKKLGYTAKHLCNIRRGFAPIPDPLLMEVGLRRVEKYEEIGR